MKRKELLGLEIYYQDNKEKKLGVIKELMINKNDFKIDFLIVIGNTIDENYIVPLHNVKFEDDRAYVGDAEDFLKLESFILFNEIKKNETIFKEKHVIDQKENVIGHIEDYQFDDETGVLSSVLYFDNVKNSIELINYMDIVESTNDYISVHVEDDYMKAKNYFDNIVNEAQSVSEDDFDSTIDLEELKSTYINSFDNIMSEYNKEIDKRMSELIKLYNFLENELIAEFEASISVMQEKREKFINTDISVIREDFKNDFKNIKKEKIKEIEKIVLLPTSDFFEKSKSTSRNKNLNINSQGLKEKELGRSFILEEDSLEERNEYISEVALSKDEPFSFESNKELERLYELQRKRMDIIKKL